jgi:hypothetical protein
VIVLVRDSAWPWVKEESCDSLAAIHFVLGLCVVIETQQVLNQEESDKN